MSSDDTGEKDLKSQFEELIAFITEANEKALSGTMPELGNLDSTVTALCQNVEGLDEEKAKEFETVMAQMILKLDELAQTLTNYQTNKEAS